jgi:group I intron endonuclease
MSILTHKVSGVYEIYNTVNGNRYIGSAVNISNRWETHRSLLRHNKHENNHIQRAFNKYGESAFNFRVIEECNPEKLIAVEQRYIDALRPEYNISPTAGNCLGVKHTQKTKANMSAAQMGHKNNLGVKRTPEARENISRAHIGKKHSPETIEKMKVARLGKKLSPETKAKISELAKARMKTPEAIAKLVAAWVVRKQRQVDESCEL